MPLIAGTKLGPYQILAPLGAGGMGEVYRAHDTRLGRDVAIKVLSPHLAAAPEVRARFEREARTISQLNHPHICTLYDVGRAPGEAGSDGTDYLVMELLEGETLAHRLEKGPLPVAEVLSLGTQIADALDRAHRAGVVHRDLKPGNVMLTKGGAKLMDFGLARAASVAATPGVMTESPTVSRPLTKEGTIVGTFQYMAPEQLEGKEADARADLWALGCVLYEMATGKHAFEGKSQASLISAIMKDEPRPITDLQPLSPPALDRVVQQCLTKDPDERIQAAHDVKLQLQWIASGGSQAGVPAPIATRRRHREWLAWALAAAALVATGGLGWALLESRAQQQDAVQAIVDPPREATLIQFRSNIAISPDGRAIAFAAFDTTGPAYLWIRPLGSDVARRIPGTADVGLPFWSPDGRYVAYFDDREGALKKISVVGGSSTTICRAPNGRGGSWNRHGTIVFAPALEGPLMRVSSAGGVPAAVTTLDTARHESGHRMPCFLPDGEHFLFAALPAGPSGWDVCVGSLRSREVKRILTAGSAAVYAEPGYLLFERDERVMAQRFDPRRLRLEGDPVAIADAPEFSNLDADPVVSASRNGRLALLRSVPPDARLALLDRTGATRARYDLPPAPWLVLSASLDARRAVVANGGDLWIVDLARSVPMRFASTPATDLSAVWSPSGDRVAYVSSHAGRQEITIAGLDGQGEVVPTTDDAFKTVNDWSRDGRYVVFGTQNAVTKFDLWLLPLQGDRKAVPYLRSPATEQTSRVSPDGRWLAYSSSETGRSEIYVQSFPRPGRKVRVSLEGGGYPLWARGGRELIYWNGQAMVSVPVQAGEEFRPGPPQPLFNVSADCTGLDVVADGERFLVSLAAETRPRDIRIVLNWQALLKR